MLRVQCYGLGIIDIVVVDLAVLEVLLQRILDRVFIFVGVANGFIRHVVRCQQDRIFVFIRIDLRAEIRRKIGQQRAVARATDRCFQNLDRKSVV